MNTLANLFAYYNNGEQDVYHFVLEKILENTELFLRGSIYEIADYCSASLPLSVGFLRNWATKIFLISVTICLMQDTIISITIR